MIERKQKDKQHQDEDDDDDGVLGKMDRNSQEETCL